MDTPSTVDVISTEDLNNQGTTQVPELMRKLVPSYNVGTQPISATATFIRPANLCGLAADQTLVLVNGKRRHRAVVISWLGKFVYFSKKFFEKNFLVQKTLEGWYASVTRNSGSDRLPLVEELWGA